MRKIGLILDSSSAITEKEAQDRGHAFIPVQIIINGKVFMSGVDINEHDVYKAQEDKNVDIKTASPNGSAIEKAFDDILTRYDKAIYIGVSTKMSGTNNAVRLISQSEKYKGKIFVYDSEYSAPWVGAYLNCFEELFNETDNIEKIYETLDLANPYMIGQLTPGNIYWFYKGGRITKLQYMAGSLMKLSPVLTIENGNMSKEKIEKIRGPIKAMNKIAENFRPIIDNMKNLKLNYSIISVKSSVKKTTQQFNEVISQKLLMPIENILSGTISNEQIAHMGPGSFGMAVFVKLKELSKAKADGRI